MKEKKKTMNFIDEQHEKEFARLLKKYPFNTDDRDRVLLFYVLAAINVMERGVDQDLIELDYSKKPVIKLDALHHGWVTDGDAKMIRLAFHLYSWRTPTCEGDNDVEEMQNYTPVKLLTGLGSRYADAAYEALNILRNWN